MENPNVGGLVTVARPSRCVVCGAGLRAGAKARLAASRQLRCSDCPAPEAVASESSAAIVLLAPTLLRGNDAAWLAAGVVTAGAVALRSKTVRRLARTVRVALRSAARIAWDRLRG